MDFTKWIQFLGQGAPLVLGLIQTAIAVMDRVDKERNKNMSSVVKKAFYKTLEKEEYQDFKETIDNVRQYQKESVDFMKEILDGDMDMTRFLSIRAGAEENFPNPENAGADEALIQEFYEDFCEELSNNEMVQGRIMGAEITGIYDCFRRATPGELMKKAAKQIEAAADNIKFDELLQTTGDWEEIVERAWSEYICIVGEGGMGKTVQLVHIARMLLNNVAESKVIPLYINLGTCGEASLYQTIYNLYFNDREPQNGYDITWFNGILCDMEKKYPDVKFVLLLDAINEFGMERVNEIINHNAGTGLLNLNKVAVIASSRYCVEGFTQIPCKALTEERIQKYCEAKDIAVNLEHAGKMLSLPFMLSLLTKVSREEQKAVQNKAALMALYCKTFLPKNRGENHAKIKAVLDLYLPLTALELFKAGGCEQLDFQEIRKAFFAAQGHLNTRNYEELFEDAEYGYQKVEWVGEVKQDGFFDIMKSTLGLWYKAEKIYKWKHEIFRDWFVAKGIRLTYEQTGDERGLECLAGKMDNCNDLVYRYPYLQPAEFLYEMFQDSEAEQNQDALAEQIAKNEAFRRCMLWLDCLYDAIENKAKTSKLAAILLDYYEEHWEDTLECCHAVRSASYMLIQGKETPETTERARKNLLRCEGLLQNLPQGEDIDKELGTIYGNLGGCCLAERRITADSAEKRRCAAEAKEFYEKGKEIRDKYQTVEGEYWKEQLAFSYTCIGTACFYQADLEGAIECHKKAYDLRKAIASSRTLISITRLTGSILIQAEKNGNLEDDMETIIAYINEGIEYVKKFYTAGELKSLTEKLTFLLELLSQNPALKETYKTETENLVNAIKEVYAGMYFMEDRAALQKLLALTGETEE